MTFTMRPRDVVTLRRRFPGKPLALVSMFKSDRVCLLDFAQFVEFTLKIALLPSSDEHVGSYPHHYNREKRNSHRKERKSGSQYQDECSNGKKDGAKRPEERAAKITKLTLYLAAAKLKASTETRGFR